VTFDAFKAALTAAEPPGGLVPELEALWWAGKGKWDKAHEVAQDHDTKPCAWVHAYLHRVEGDKANAAYWYRRAGHEPEAGALDAEWELIARELLSR
jgi:hypothetical protein